MKKNTSNEVEFLQILYKNSEMGVIAIDNIISKVKNEDLEDLLKSQKDEYNHFCGEIENVLKKYGKQNEEVGTMAKVGTAVMSEISLLKDDSIQNIAKMMIEGTNKGIIELTEKINSFEVDDAEIILLANKLKEIEENNVEKLKKYL